MTVLFPRYYLEMTFRRIIHDNTIIAFGFILFDIIYHS